MGIVAWIVLGLGAGLLAKGEAIGWVAIHRRRHAFSDRPGDPHSPYRYGSSVTGQPRGLAHAHTGWLLSPLPASGDRIR